VRGGEVLCKVIGKVGAAGCPVYVEAFLFYSVSNPVVPHVDGS
jgi:hypothetical protein